MTSIDYRGRARLRRHRSLQSMLSLTPEHRLQAGCLSMRPGSTPSWPQAQVPRVRFAC